MVNKEIEQIISTFKEEHIAVVEAIIKNYSYLIPQLSVLHYDNIKKDYGVVNFDIPGEFMNSETGKDLFGKMVPTVLNRISKQDKVPICIGWSTEAWVRECPADKGLPENWKELPKTEGIINYFESEDKSEIVAYNILRDGSRVDEEGNIIDDVALILNTTLSSAGKEGPKLEGRFCNLFKKFKEDQSND